MTERFPEDFLIGASTAAHQIEGNNVNSTWWALEHRPNTLLAEPSGDAADSLHRRPDDLDLVRSLGYDAYRFSIEWARVELAPGEFSRAMIQHYGRMIEGAIDRGIVPVVTLHHFTEPLWFAKIGGWRSEAAVASFVRYVENGPVREDPPETRTLTGWEYYPETVEHAVRHTRDVVGDVPILVTENGIATTDDSRRIAYTRRALHGLHRAMADGIDVRGYLHWSLLDNYEWGSFGPTFGLIGWDRETFDRTPKPSAHWLGEVARTRSVR